MIVCQRCGRENDGRYRFCLGCGAALPASARPSSTSATPAAPPPVPSAPPPPPPPPAAPAAVRPPPSAPPPAPPADAPPVSTPRTSSSGQVPISPLPPRGAPPATARARPKPAAAPSFTARPAGDPEDDVATVAFVDPPPPPRAAVARTSHEHGPRASGATELRCVQCSTPIPPGYAFCGVCGTPRGRSESAAMAPAPVREAGALALIDDLGNESVRYPLVVGENRIGRDTSCEVAFDSDGLLAGVHCVLKADEQPFRLRPLDMHNGTYLRISTPVELHHGDIIRVGQEVLRFERIEELTAETSPITGRTLTVGCAMPRGVWGRVCQIGMARQVANAYLLSHRDVFLGRERGDILFPKDGFVSGSHAVISERGGRVYLKDLGSSNGTFLRIKREITLRNSDLLLLGRNLLRVHVGAA